MRPADPTFFDLYDALLLDMDGTLMHGANPIEHAASSVRAARERGLKIRFATNNASRTPQMVVEHLGTMGYEAFAEEVINSPMVAVALLKKQVAPPATVLAVGGAGLVEELKQHGYTVTREDAAEVAAVVQGFAPDVAWKDLAEAAYALNHGAAFFATNMDSTLPTEKGFAPGNGSLVRALIHATGIRPVAAGKPEPGMFTVAAESAESARPLAVGDRLDTDLEGGNRAQVPTFHVLTGVSGWLDAVHAPAIQRPVFIRPDMSYLGMSAAQPVVEEQTAHLGATRATLENGRIVVRGEAGSWRTPQVVISLVNSLFAQESFEGEVVAEAGELYPPLAR